MEQKLKFKTKEKLKLPQIKTFVKKEEERKEEKELKLPNIKREIKI